MSNRASAPPITTLHQLDLPDPKVYYLDNGIPVYELTPVHRKLLSWKSFSMPGGPLSKKLWLRGH